MNLRETIYEAMWQEYGTNNQFLWEDLVRWEIAPITGPPSEREKRWALQRGVELQQRETLESYLRWALPDEFHSLHRTVSLEEGPIYSNYLGVLDGALVDVILTSTHHYAAPSLDTKTALAAAAKAFLNNRSTLYIGQIDRNTQDWSWFKIVGDFEPAYKYIVDSAKDWLSGKDKRRTPPNKLHVVPEPSLGRALDEGLYKLNGASHVNANRVKKAFHPSEISTTICDRALAYSLIGEDEEEHIEPKLRRIFDVGTAYHNTIQNALGWCVPGFKSEVRVRNKDLRIEGSCDGVIENEGIEIKSIGASGFRKLTRAKPEHAEQATIYGINLDLDFLHYVYICKEDADINIFRTPIDRGLWHRIATRISQILFFVDKKELPPKLSGKDSTCKSCKFCWICKPELSKQNSKRMFFR